MSIRILLKDVFEHIHYLDKNIENPFINRNNQGNPFAQFYGGTYVWVDPPEKKLF